MLMIKSMTYETRCIWSKAFPRGAGSYPAGDKAADGMVFPQIDDALKANGMTQKELAERIGTSAAAVSRWLGGGHNFTLSTLAKISAVLGVPLISVAK